MKIIIDTSRESDKGINCLSCIYYNANTCTKTGRATLAGNMCEDYKKK